MKTPNSDIAQRYLKAIYQKDYETANNLLAENITLTMNGNNKLSGIRIGKPAFFEAFERMMQLTQFSYKMIDEIEWLEGHSRALLLAVETATKNNVSYHFNRAIDYQIQDGKIQAIKIYEGEPVTVDLIFS